MDMQCNQMPVKRKSSAATMSTRLCLRPATRSPSAVTGTPASSAVDMITVAPFTLKRGLRRDAGMRIAEGFSNGATTRVAKGSNKSLCNSNR